VLAQRIHARSPRRGKPLIVVNCAAIPETLEEGTLFGHVRGAFTGATQQQKGLFEAADGGTLMLDEIGDLPRSSQAALLRVLETGKVRRVGAAEEVDVNVRVIAATHRDLEAMCDEGEFRSDLLYRLNGVSVTVPPLRDRREDLSQLIEVFLARANEENGRAIKGIDAEASALLVAYDWPGNVRELRNAIERAVVLTHSDMITAEDLPDRVRSAAAKAAALMPTPAPAVGPAPSEAAPLQFSSKMTGGGGDRERGSPTHVDEGDFRARVEHFEKQLLVEALNESGGNQKAAAARLGLPLRTLVHKLSMFGIKRAPYVSPDGPKKKK
jgi:transcriptional regulator with GAF, ATPase, and Fis domain